MLLQYVVVRQDGRLEWEPGENRCIHVPPPGLAAALAAAKQAVAAEEASGGNGKRPLSPPGRRLTPAEIYAAQEAEEQLEPWQLVERDNAEKHVSPFAATTASTSVGWLVGWAGGGRSWDAIYAVQEAEEQLETVAVGGEGQCRETCKSVSRGSACALMHAGGRGHSRTKSMYGCPQSRVANITAGLPIA